MYNQREIRSHRIATLAGIKAISNAHDKTMCFCDETQTLYKYLAAGSAFTANDENALTTGAAGNTRWIGVGGQHNYYNRGSVTGRTITVGTGKDFSTIQAALDSLKYTLCTLPTIQLDAGTYSENLDFSGLYGSVKIRGNSNAYLGETYIDGLAIVTRSSGSGTCTLANSGNDITVTGSVANPPMTMLSAGMKLVVRDNAGAITEETVSSVAANVVTLTGTAPTLGNTGCYVIPCSDRILTKRIEIDNPNLTLKLAGIYLAGTGCPYAMLYLEGRTSLKLLNTVIRCTDNYYSLQLVSGASLEKTDNTSYKNIALIGENYGFVMDNAFSLEEAFFTEKTSINNSELYSTYTFRFANAIARIKRSRGYLKYDSIKNRIECTASQFYLNGNIDDIGGQSGLVLYNSDICVAGGIINNCTTAIKADQGSRVKATNVTTSNNTTGYHALNSGVITKSSGTETGNVTDYSPAAANTEGNQGAWIYR